MENTVFDILVYVFDRYMLEELPAETERETIERDLARVGFGEAKVTRALDWLADLAEFRNGAGPGPSALAFRAFNASEMRRLDADCRGLLSSLEQGGILLAPATTHHLAAWIVGGSMPAALEPFRVDRLEPVSPAAGMARR